jgi:hypothetical protein
VTEKPLAKLLDREKAAAEVAQHFQEHLDALTDMVNYGTNLIIRAYSSSEKRSLDVVVLGVLLKQMVAMLDAADVLLRAGIVHATFLPARAALEASLYIDWILLSNSDHKAACYLVASLRHERMWALRGMKGSPEAKAMDAVMAELGIDIHEIHPDLEEGASKHLDEVNRNLAQSDLKPIDELFDQIRKKRGRDFDPEWYAPAGAKSLRQMAKELGRLPQYEFNYSKGSHVTHSALYKDHVRFKKQQVRFRAIRSLRDIDELLNTTMPVFFGTYLNIVKHYRAGEAQAFARHYVEHWRGPFLGVKQVKIVEAD